MQDATSINLIRISNTTPGHEGLEKSLTKGAFIAFFVLLLTGTLGSGMYLHLTQRLDSLESTKSMLLTQISKESTKEALHLAIKDRTYIVSNVFARQYRADKAYDLVYRITTPPILTGFSLAKDNLITVRFSASTLEEVGDILFALQLLFTQKTVRQPRIESFQLDEKEGIKVSVAFYQISNP